MGKLSDLTGLRFGHLTVVQRSGVKNGHAAWECKCDYGETIITTGNQLKSGKAKSCGCKRGFCKAGLHYHPKGRTYCGAPCRRRHRQNDQSADL